MRRLPLVALAAAWMAAAPSAAQEATREELLDIGRAAAASGDHAAAYRAFRQAYDPGRDDPGVLAALAGVAAAAGEMVRFRALLDSVVDAGSGHRHALAYWAALALEAGTPAASVVRELDTYLASHRHDVAAHEGFVRVLNAHGAASEGLELLDRAAARGAPPEAIALSRGDARAHLGEAAGAVAAYAEALVWGDERGEARIRDLLAAWPAGSTPADALTPLEEARDRAEPASRARLVALLAQARTAAGEGEAALAEVRDEPDPAVRAEALRGVVLAARRMGDVEVAQRASEALAGIRRAVQGPGDETLEVEGVDLAAGDIALARGQADSAIAAYATAAAGAAGGAGELEALSRIRLVRALVLARAPRAFVADLGAALSEPRDPARVAARLDSLSAAATFPDSASARALVVGLAAEWRGRAGDPQGASAALEAAALGAGLEAPALLLAAGRWAAAASDLERARALWRRVVERHDATPYALEARRLLAQPGGETR